MPSKPGEGARVAEEAVRRLWRSWGFVEEVYWPGRSRRLVVAPDADNVVPTAVCVSVGSKKQNPGYARVVLAKPWRH